MTITLIKREELFKSECKLINLKYEYIGYTGKERWAVVSDLSMDEINLKYSDVLCEYVPFVLLSTTQGQVIDEYKRNEHKHEMRQKRHGHIFDLSDGDFEQHHSETAYECDFAEEIMKQDYALHLREIIKTLSEVQKRRIIKYYFQGKSIREIAKEENVNSSKIQDSINLALKKIKKLF